MVKQPIDWYQLLYRQGCTGYAHTGTNATGIGGSRQGPVSGKIKTPAGDAPWGPEIEKLGAFLFYQVSNLSIVSRNVF